MDAKTYSLWSTTLIGSAIALSLAACKEDKPAPPPPRPARVVEISPHDIAFTASASGQIQARYVSNVGFLVSGRLISRNVDIGANVTAGTLLARIDDVDFQNKLAAARSQVSAAQADVDQAAPQEERYRTLLASGYATQANYDQSLRMLENAKAGLVAAQANLRLAEDNLRYTQLQAPTDGAVTQTGADVGQVVAAGQMVIQISRLDEREAVFSVAARDASRAVAGIKIKVWLQDDPSRIVEGSVREISPNADPVTGTYTVKVSLPDAPDSMRLGAIVIGQAQVAAGVLPTMVSVPPMALLQTGDTAQVWVVSPEDDTVHKRPVTVTRYEAEQVYISKGLNRGDLVVVAGVNTLNEGQKIVPQKVSGQ